MNPEVEAFLAARRYTRAEVLGGQCPVPKEHGVYGWWFRTVPKEIEVSACQQQDDLTLLYTGISPKSPPTNGRNPSRQRLRDRIRAHYRGDAYGSTLRLTLGLLLGLRLRLIGSSDTRMTFGTEGEEFLSEWMDRNTLVAWRPCLRPWELEDTLIAVLDLPLNLRGNEGHPLHPILTRLRGQAKANARKQPRS